ncbi:hypothetical protein JCM19000A_27170 [Silvimonas sp. JCM 19000]
MSPIARGLLTAYAPAAALGVATLPVTVVAATAGAAATVVGGAIAAVGSGVSAIGNGISHLGSTINTYV